MLRSRIEELQKLLEDRDRVEGTHRDKIITLEEELKEAKCLKYNAEAKISGLVKKLQEKDSKGHKMKANYRDKITGLKKKLKEKFSEINEEIRSLRGQIEEEREANRIAEAALRREECALETVIKEAENHCSQVQRMRYDQIYQTKVLKRKLRKQMTIHQEKESDWSNVEKALRGEIKQLKETISLMESDKEKVTDAHPCDIKAQMDAQQQPDGMFQADIFVNSQNKELDEMLQGQINIHREEKSDGRNVEKATHGQIKRVRFNDIIEYKILEPPTS
jgi:chromosome segregation ATPase